MKLYFYGLNSDGIFVTEVEVIEKPKTYYPVDKKRGFPNCMSFVRKEDEGILQNFSEVGCRLSQTVIRIVCQPARVLCTVKHRVEQHTTVNTAAILSVHTAHKCMPAVFCRNRKCSCRGGIVDTPISDFLKVAYRSSPIASRAT